MDFESLKTSSSGFDKLTKALEENLNPEDSKNKNKYQDDRLWKPELDKTGNGYAVLRFLPATSGEDMPWVRVWSHAFQGPGGWYIENSLTTLGHKDPVSEENTRLWNTGAESDKQVARNRKRKLSYYSNVLVVSDPAHPENEGQVKLFKFGKKIFDKITEAMQPEFDDDEAINPFDFWQGANFKLKIKQVAGFWNYDSSEFAAVGPLLSDDKQLETIYDNLYDLSEFTAADQFKSYDDLKKRLNSVLGTKQQLRAPDPETVDEELGNDSANDEELSKLAAAATGGGSSDPDEDDALSYFQKLAEE